MAAGAGGSGGSLESTLDRKFQSVSNTMDSIQGLSTWCIDNKKYHSLIVRYWIKWMRKSDTSHRLNLFYLANDVIQNCKRKNAIVYRTAFADVLPDAFLLMNSDGDSKVMKSVERVLSIWEERNVYSGTLITELRGYLVKEVSPPETPAENFAPTDNKAALKSKIVAEFVPQALIDQLSKYKRSMEEVEIREKQLAAMRVDVCNAEALKKLKDKVGGKKYSKDFEEGSIKLQDFVKFLDRQSKGGPLLLEALSNADIFYEMQYQEVKIVANAYQTFANRVSHLKRKLDSLKATLPDLDESPIPSPSADAPSPTGSESPFRGLEMTNPDPDLDGCAMDDEAERPAPSPLSEPGASPKHVFSVGENDNWEVADMDLSEDEMEGGGIQAGNIECPTPVAVPDPVTAGIPPSTATEPVILAPPSSADPQAAPSSADPQAAPSSADPLAGLTNVDLSKISSLLNSLTSTMQNTGAPVESTTPVASTGPSVKTAPSPSVASPDTSSLVNILSHVDVTAEGLLSALSKAQGSSLQGLSSLLSSPVAKVSSDPSSTGKLPPSALSSIAPTSAAPAMSQPPAPVAPVASPPVPAARHSHGAQARAPLATPNRASALVQALHDDMELTAEPDPSVSSDSLESKIHSFLQANSAFSAFNLGFGNQGAPSSSLSPLTGTDTQGGTPVRDEGGGTPTQDEIMDKPAVDPFTPGVRLASAVETATTAAEGRLPPSAYQHRAWQDPNKPQQRTHMQSAGDLNGQSYQPYLYSSQERAGHGIANPAAHNPPAQLVGSMPREGALGTYPGGSMYAEGSALQSRPHGLAPMEGGIDSQTTRLFPYQAEQAQDPQGLRSQQDVTTTRAIFHSSLPPMPQLPPPPKGFEASHAMAGGEMLPPERQPVTDPETVGVSGASIIEGMVVHDHQHKPVFHHDEPLYHPDNLYPPPDDQHYQEHYHEDPCDVLLYPEDPHWPPEDPYYRPASPPHGYPRGRGLTPPLSPPEGAYYDYYPHGSSPPHRGLRRPLPPHPEMRQPGPRPHYRPPHPQHHPPLRGGPRGPPFPPFRGPNPWLRGKRPGPRGGPHGGPAFPPKRPYPPPRY